MDNSAATCNKQNPPKLLIFYKLHIDKSFNHVSSEYHIISVQIKKVKVKASHTRYRASSPELIPVYRQSAYR